MKWRLGHAALATPLVAVAVAAMAAPDAPPSPDSRLLAQLQTEVKTDRAQITRLEGQLKVTMLDRVLFPEGGWRLGAAGEKTLQQLVPTLRDLKNTRIVVNGFTDNLPIAAPYQDRFATNWELAGTRASEVVRYLAAQGVNPDLLSAVSRGETHPAASNDTATGRDQNRRIEVTLVGADT